MLIALLSDLGDAYAAQMKGVIYRINPKAKLVDISHDIKPQNIRQGAWLLYTTAPHFPSTIWVGVVDPGVGTARGAIIVTCQQGFLVGPDNGLLIPGARRLGIKEVYEIGEKPRSLFHGRDLFAPIAARLSLGASPTQFGKRVEHYIDLDFGSPRITKTKIIGKVVYCDKFGNLITNIPAKEVLDKFRYNSFLKVRLSGRDLRIRFLSAYGNAREKGLLGTISSTDTFELACNKGNATEVLKAGEEEKVEILLGS